MRILTLTKASACMRGLVHAINRVTAVEMVCELCLSCLLSENNGLAVCIGCYAIYLTTWMIYSLWASLLSSSSAACFERTETPAKWSSGRSIVRLHDEFIPCLCQTSLHMMMEYDNNSPDVLRCLHRPGYRGRDMGPRHGVQGMIQGMYNTAERFKRRKERKSPS